MSLNDLDYLSPKISLFYYGKHRHSANFGAILTILMIFFCFIYIFYLFFEVYLHTSSTIQYYRHFFTDPYSYLFNNHNGIFHFFQIYNPKNNSHVSSFNSKYIRIFLSNIQEEYKTNPEILSVTEHWVYDNCREGIDNKFLPESLFKNVYSFKRGLCIRYYYNIIKQNYYPIEDTINFKYPNITSSGLNRDYSMGAIIEKCNNNSILTKLFGVCGEINDLENYLAENYGINFNILTNEISPTDYGNQIYNFIYGVSNPMKRKKIIENNIIIAPLKIDINGGVFFPTKKQNQTYSYYENYVLEEERNENSKVLSIYNFCLSQSGYVFKSTYLTIYDSFPKIGGIIQLIYYIFFGINFILNRFTIINDTKKLFFTLHNDELVNGGGQIQNFTNIVNRLRRAHKLFTIKAYKNNSLKKEDLNKFRLSKINLNCDKKNDNNDYKCQNNNNSNNDSFLQKNFENDNNKSNSILPLILEKDIFLYKPAHLPKVKEKKLNLENSDIIIERRKSNQFKTKILKDEIVKSSNESKAENEKNVEIKDSNNNEDDSLKQKKDEIIEIRKNRRKSKEKNELHKCLSHNIIDNEIVYFKLLLQKYFKYKKKTFIYEKMTVDQINIFFSFRKYLLSLLCYKKPKNYYLTLIRFRKKLLSEEHFFRTHNYLYLFEKCFDIQESEKIDIIELYKNL